MSFYVRRTGGFTGPIRSSRQAEREAAAWRSCGQHATVEPSSPKLRREVRDWQREADIRHGRRR